MEGAELQRLIKKCRAIVKKKSRMPVPKGKKRNVSDVPITKGPYA